MAIYNDFVAGYESGMTMIEIAKRIMSVRERFTGIKRIMTKSPKQNSRPFCWHQQNGQM